MSAPRDARRKPSAARVWVCLFTLIVATSCEPRCEEEVRPCPAVEVLDECEAQQACAMSRQDTTHCGPDACGNVRYFAIADAPQRLDIPVSLFEADLAAHPVMKVGLLASAPIADTEVTILVDGVPACAMGEVYRNSRYYTCDPPPSGATLSIVCARTPVAFMLSVALSDPECVVRRCMYPV